MRVHSWTPLFHLLLKSDVVNAFFDTPVDLSLATLVRGDKEDMTNTEPLSGRIYLNFINETSNSTATRRLQESDGEVIAGSAEAPLIFNRSDHLMSGLLYEDLFEDPHDASEPGYDARQDPFSLDFHGYQNQDVVEPWMLDMLRGMYHVRKAEGVHQPLCFNEKLLRMAKEHVKDIVDQELLLSHIGTDGKDSGARIDASGYHMTAYGATISATQCTSVDCALINRPLFFTKQNKYNQFAIAKEEYDSKGNPRWYFVFAGSDTEPCFGMNVSTLEWPEGTPTMAPVPEPVLPPIIPGDGGEMIEDWHIGLLALVNAERKNEGSEDLCFNKKLMLAAQLHNQDQVDNDFMGHYGSDGSTVAERVTRQGYEELNYVSENCAKGQWTIRDAMYAWMSSSGQHAQNIINPNAKHIGLARDEPTGTYTLVFGNYFTDDEVCISTVQCEGTTSYLDNVDPTYSKYSCSLCLNNNPWRQFGVMGCGFGVEWYHKNSLEDYMLRS